MRWKYVEISENKIELELWNSVCVCCVSADIIGEMSSDEDEDSDGRGKLSACSLEQITTYFGVLTFVNFLNYVDRGVIPGSTNEFNSFIQVSIHNYENKTLPT